MTNPQQITFGFRFLDYLIDVFSKSINVDKLINLGLLQILQEKLIKQFYFPIQLDFFK